MSGDKFWYRREVGNPTKWDEIGALQFEYLLSKGLQKDHHFLDVGCGPLRAGTHFIRYLNPSRYVGIDNNNELLNAARLVEIPLHKLEGKNPALRLTQDFDLSWLPEGRRFNFGIAQSLFTHLTPKQIVSCLASVGARLALGGKFFATFNPSKDGKVFLGGRHPRRKELDWTYFPPRLIRGIAEGVGLEMEHVGDWGHPLNRKGEQEMLSFRRER